MKTPFTRLGALVAFVLGAAVASAQPHVSPDAKIAAVAKLRLLEGTWEGTGWMVMGPQGKSEFLGTETVQRDLGGVVLTVRGVHRRGDQVIHEALGVISFDEASGNYAFKSYLASGREGDFTAKLIENGIEWGFENPHMGRIRYTLRISADGTTWHEIGEMSRDGGTTWFQTMEMTLQKK